MWRLETCKLTVGGRAPPGDVTPICPILCRHYCYPGPADYWALALYNLLLNNAKFATGAVRPAVLPAPGGAGQRRRRRVQ